MFGKQIPVCIIFMIAMAVTPALAQTVSPQNFSNVRVDDLTDDQIRQYMRQIEATGLSDGQLEQVAAARGMRPEEIRKLRQRVERIRKEDGKQGDQGSSMKRDTIRTRFDDRERRLNYEEQDSLYQDTAYKTEAERALAELKSKIFGANLFRNTNLTFEPNLRIATPANYVIGPDDEIQIDITGDNEANYELKVSPEGTVRVEYAGIVEVNGLSVEQASARIRSRLSATYPSIRSGRTIVSISLGNIRSIKVTLLGEVVKPGSYTLPSLATVFNALYVSGGPNENGSFREIEVVRNNKVIATLDIYNFLLKGFQTNNIRLQDQDIIRIPTYKVRAEFTGEVKRPAIFEVLPGENLADVINFAGGFTDRAYTARIKVLQNTSRERRITDVFADRFDNYSPKSGDKYFVEPILDRFENRVVIEGAVFRPGQFELEPGLTLAKLIKKADGVTEDAFLSRGYITRLKADNSTELLTFDLDKILAGKVEDIPLKREDIITISSIFDLREEYKVSVDGEVRDPGTYDFSENMTLEDIIIKSGGFKEGASAKRIEISRRIKNSNVLSVSAKTAQVFQVDVDKDLKFDREKFVLQPFDIISVRNETGYEIQQQVRIEGEVLYPGTYTVTSKDERISDLIKRAGGLTALAYAEGASLKRPGPPVKVTEQDSIKKSNKEDLERLYRFQRLQGLEIDSTALDEEEEVLKNLYVGINLERILTKPGSNYDLTLQEGDTLYVPKQLQTIKVSGEVLSPVTIIYNKGKSFSTYISEAGGFSDRSLKRRAYVIYANGSVKSTKKFLFFNNFPVVKPGAEIFVPQKPQKVRVTAGEIVGISTGLATLAAVLLNLLQ